MNMADSQRVGSSLEHLGDSFTDKAEEADVIVLNTCVVRQSAEDKALERVTQLRPLKDRNPNLVIIVPHKCPPTTTCSNVETSIKYNQPLILIFVNPRPSS